MSRSISAMLAEAKRLQAKREVQSQKAAALDDPKYRLIDSLFTEESRAGYAKHMEVIGAGRESRSRLFIAANRVGKTLLGAYETALHLTGRYPDWWHGIRFSEPTLCWAAGVVSPADSQITGPFFG